MGFHISDMKSFMWHISEVAQIQLDLIFLRKSTRLLSLIKIFHPFTNFDETLENETSDDDFDFVQVSLRLDKR